MSHIFRNHKRYFKYIKLSIIHNVSLFIAVHFGSILKFDNNCNNKYILLDLILEYPLEEHFNRWYKTYNRQLPYNILYKLINDPTKHFCIPYIKLIPKNLHNIILYHNIYDLDYLYNINEETQCYVISITDSPYITKKIKTFTDYSLQYLYCHLQNLQDKSFPINIFYWISPELYNTEYYQHKILKIIYNNNKKDMMRDIWKFNKDFLINTSNLLELLGYKHIDIKLKSLLLLNNIHEKL